MLLGAVTLLLPMEYPVRSRGTPRAATVEKKNANKGIGNEKGNMLANGTELKSEVDAKKRSPQKECMMQKMRVNKIERVVWGCLQVLCN